MQLFHQWRGKKERETGDKAVTEEGGRGTMTKPRFSKEGEFYFVRRERSAKVATRGGGGSPQFLYRGGGNDRRSRLAFSGGGKRDVSATSAQESMSLKFRSNLGFVRGGEKLGSTTPRRKSGSLSSLIRQGVLLKRVAPFPGQRAIKKNRKPGSRLCKSFPENSSSA